MMAYILSGSASNTDKESTSPQTSITLTFWNASQPSSLASFADLAAE
jgi:hypothetical protein